MLDTSLYIPAFLVAAAEPAGLVGLRETAFLAPGGILALGLVTCSSLASCS